MKQVLQLFNYTVLNQGSGTVDVHIDGEIVDAPTQEILKDWFNDETSVSYKSFRNQVEAASPKTVNVYINSPGGVVSDAMAIHDYLAALEEKGVTVNRKGIGIVASAATYILAGPDNEMSENSMLMIHNIQMIAIGDINQIENQARAGRKFNNLIRDFYAKQTGKPAETISAWMNKETWFTAQEAKDNGFVKNISGKAKFKNAIKPERWPFENTAILNTYNSFTQNTEEMKMDLTKIKDAVKNALVELGFKKPEDKDDVKLDAEAEKITNAITAGIAEGMKPFEQISDVVKTEVAACMKDFVKTEGLTAQITAAVNAGVTAATKDLVKKTDFDQLTNSIVQKLGAKSEDKNEDEGKERKFKNKNEFYQVGSFEKKSA